MFLFIKSIKNVNVNPVYDTAGAAKIISAKRKSMQQQLLVKMLQRNTH